MRERSKASNCAGANMKNYKLAAACLREQYMNKILDFRVGVKRHHVLEDDGRRIKLTTTRKMTKLDLF